MGDISVIIVSWNARAYLRQCLDSIRSTGGGRVKEIIVVDNGSTDGSPHMVEADYQEVVLIKSRENLGFARANNLAMERATGAQFALVNSDVVLHEGCLQTLASYLDAHPDVGVVGPKVVGGDGHVQRTCRRLPSVWNTVCESFGLDTAFARCPSFSGREMRHWDQDALAEVEVLSGCFWLARANAAREIGGLDERFFFYAEDVDWCKRLRDANWRVVFVPLATATHFGGGSSANAPEKYCIEMLRANLRYWEKYHGIPGRVMYHALSTVYHGLRLALRAPAKALGLRRGEAFDDRFRENRVCLRWLLTGQRV